MGARKARQPNLTAAEKQAIRDYHEANPKLFYWQIAAHFKRGTTSIYLVINGGYQKPAADPPPRERMALPPSCSVKQPDSILSPIPLSLLMAGRAPRAKLQPA